MKGLLCALRIRSKRKQTESADFLIESQQTYTSTAIVCLCVRRVRFPVGNCG